MGRTRPPRRRLSWRVHLAWAAAWLASMAVFGLAGAALGGSDDPLGATVPAVGTVTVLLAYLVLRHLPEGQPAAATVRALGRLVVLIAIIGVVMGYLSRSSRLG